MGKKSQKAVGQLTAQRRYELRSRRSAVCSDNKATGTPNTGATDEAADQGGSKLFELDSEIPRKKRTKKTQDRDDKIHETESPVLVGGYELGSYSNNSDHQVTNVSTEGSKNSISQVGSITQDNKVGETIVTQEQRLSRKRKRSENSVDIGAILQSKPYLEYLVIRMKESLAAKKMETYHLYTLSLLAEIIDDVEKAKDLYEALPTLSKDVLGGLISDELLRGVKKGDKTISMVYPTSETDDQGLGWEQWPLLVRGVENAMKKNGTPANGTTVDISNQTIGSDRSHIKFRAYKGFTMAHIDLVKEEEKWVQQISHSVFAAAGQKGEGGHQDSWNQTYTVESKKEFSDLKAKIDDLQKEIKDKEATIKGILDDQQAKLQIQRELDAENESYEEQLRGRFKEASEEASRNAKSLHETENTLKNMRELWGNQADRQQQQINISKISLEAFRVAEIDYKEAIAKRDISIEKAKLDLDRMKRLEREKEAKIFDQQQELAVLEKKQQEEKEAFMSTNKNLKAEVVGIQAKTDTLKEQVDFLQRKNTEWQKEAEEQKSKIHKNDLIIIEYDTKLKVQEQKIGELERQLHEKQTEINDADKERKLTMQNMEDKKQKEKDLAEDLYKKGEEVQALQRKLNETEKQRQVCHKQVGDLEEKHSAVLKEIGEKRREIDKMTSQSEVNIKGYQEQLSNKDKEINNFLKQVTELEGKMKKLEAELLNSGEANSKRFNKLQTEFINVDKERLKLLADQEELVKENNILQNSVKTAKKEAEDKEKDHVEIEQKLKAQLSSVLNEIKSPKDINSGMEHVLDISTAVNEVLRYLKKSSNETKELREKLAKAEERCLIDGREIEDKDSKFSKDLEDVNKKVSELEEQLNNAQSQCQIEVSEKIKFEQELGTTKQALAEKRDLEDQISQRQAEEVKLKEQNESLKNKINRLEGEVTTLKKEFGQVQSSGCQLQKKLNEVEKDREKEQDKAASKDVQIADKDRVVQELHNKLHETRKKLQDEEAKSQAEAKSYSEQLKMGEDEQEVLEKQITSLTAEVHRLTKELTEARAQASQHQTSEKTPRRPLNLQTRGISQSTNVERATDSNATSQGSRSHMKTPSSCDTAIRFSPGKQGQSQSHSPQSPPDSLISTTNSCITVSSVSNSSMDSLSSFIPQNSSDPVGDSSSHDSGIPSPITPCPAKQHTRQSQLDLQGLRMNPGVKGLIDSANAQNCADSTVKRRNTTMPSRTLANGHRSISGPTKRVTKPSSKPIRYTSPLVGERASQSRDSHSQLTSVEVSGTLTRHSPDIRLSTQPGVGTYLGQSSPGQNPFKEQSGPWLWNDNHSRLEDLIQSMYEKVNKMGEKVNNMDEKVISLSRLAIKDTNKRVASESSVSDKFRDSSSKRLSAKNTNIRKSPEPSDSDSDDAPVRKRLRPRNNVSSGTKQPTMKSVIKVDKPKRKQTRWGNIYDVRTGNKTETDTTETDTTDEESPRPKALEPKKKEEGLEIRLDNQRWPITRIDNPTGIAPKVIVTDAEGEFRAPTLKEVLCLGTKQTCEDNTLCLRRWYSTHKKSFPDSLAFVSIEAISGKRFKVGFERTEKGTKHYKDGFEARKLYSWGYRAAHLMGEEYITRFLKSQAKYIETAKDKLHSKTKK
ncbi:hypothetical protein H9L39_20237 [Fusarium oxysporum f. sp. albedinis]|nr:hypothetical protein H9L39_20237 [Fusarium oxysporum f. sp. albedinis]